MITLPDDTNEPITPELIDVIYDLETEAYLREPTAQRLERIGNYTVMQAQLKIEMLERKIRIFKDDPALRNVGGFHKDVERRVFKKHGYNWKNKEVT